MSRERENDKPVLNQVYTANHETRVIQVVFECLDKPLLVTQGRRVSLEFRSGFKVSIANLTNGAICQLALHLIMMK